MSKFLQVLPFLFSDRVFILFCFLNFISELQFPVFSTKGKQMVIFQFTTLELAVALSRLKVTCNDVHLFLLFSVTSDCSVNTLKGNMLTCSGNLYGKLSKK